LACEGAELVIVAEPLSKIEKTFAAISPNLGSGTIVTDTAPLKAPVLRWAENFLPQHISFLGGHLILNPAVVDLKSPEGLDDANPDLLREALYCFTASPDVSSRTIDICAGLAHSIGAHPLFMDVTEHDGLQAGVEGLPDLLTIALLRATIDTPGWEEMRKFAGRRFLTATEAIDADAERHSSLFLNRENLVHRLDTLVEELTDLRSTLSQGDEEALAAMFVEAAKGRSRWMRERRKGMWAEDVNFDMRDVPGAGQQISRMFFGNLASRLRPRPGESEEE
jgi:prephenate dehydrogenase